MKLFKTVGNIIGKYPLLGDGAIALVLALSAFFGLRDLWAVLPPPVNPFLASFLVALEIVPIAWRRIFPSIVILTIAAAAIALQLLNIQEMNLIGITFLLSLFSAATYGGKRRNIACAVGVAALWCIIIYKVVQSGAGELGLILAVFNIVWNLIIFLGIWWLGNTLRKSRQQTAQLKEQKEQLEREREQNARRAILDERVRIARELHDVLAHHVSVMGIQAGAARQVLKQFPEKALNSLNLIESSSRQAVAELYRLLDLMRDEKQVETFTSQPGLWQLEKLVAEMQDSGLQVQVKIEGEKRNIPQAVDLSAYRIVEEALTNTLKHAGQVKATVSLDFQKDSLLLDILDTGKGVVGTQEISPRGKGLLGMRERVKLLKGEFWAGNSPGGGFHIRARLPLVG
jgi:signal transduction histidine kinase